MSKAVPWSVKGVDFDAREAAKEAARRSGMPVGEWLNSVIAEHAYALGVHVDEIGEEERIAAVSKRIAPAAAPLAPAPRPAGARRSDRPLTQAPDARPQARERTFRNEVPYRDEPAWRGADPRLPSRKDDEHFLELMAQRFEANAARAEQPDAVVTLARRLETLEAQLLAVGAGRRAASEHNVLSEIDRKLDSLGRRLRAGEPETVEADALRAPERAPSAPQPHPDIARIEAKLDSMASRARRVEPRDNIAMAIEEITRRQSALDGGRGRAPAPLASRRTARLGADRFAGEAAAPARHSAPIADLRNDISQLAAVVNEMRRDAAETQRTLRESAADSAQVASLQNDVSVLLDALRETRREAIVASPDAGAPGDTREIASLRRDVATLLDAVGEVQRTADTAQTATPEIVELRRQIVGMGERIAQLAPSEAVASLEGAVKALGRRVSTSRQEGVRDSIVEPIEGLIFDLKRTLADFAPNGVLRTIERQMLAMARNVEALANAGAGPQTLGRLQDQIAEIHALLLEAAATSGNVKHIEAQVGELAARVDRIAERGSTKAGSDAVAECVDDIRSELSRSGIASVFQALEQRMESLSRKIDEAVSQTASREQIGFLSDRIEDVRQTVHARAQGAGSLDVARLEALMHDVQARLDRPGHDVAEVVQLQDLVRKLAQRIETAFAAGETPGQLGGLEKQVQEIFHRLDRSPLAAAGAERLESLLHEVSERLERPVSPTQLEQVQQTIRLLAEKFEATVRANGAQDVLKGLEEQVAKMATRLEAPVSAELDTSRLEAMIQSLSTRLDTPAPPQPDHSLRLESMMSDIAARLDEPQRHDEAAQMRELLRLLSQRIEAQRSEAPGYAALEDQIQRLAARIDGADGADALASLERSIGDIFSQMEQFRETALLTAEHAARKAAREAIESRPAEREGAPGMNAMLTREISALRSMQDAAEKRTSATLNAVHETLERVVDRLAMIETDLDSEPARPASPQAPVTESAPQAPAPSPAPPAPVAAAHAQAHERIDPPN
ncbi:MAG: peptidoglycan-binding protein, partial [Hyphomicrobiales bacterium]|nr:peptidoglycan-binding protein [Hyphomicrobiales bacterium]